MKPFPAGEVDRRRDLPANEDLTVIFRAELNGEDFTVTEEKDAASMRGKEGRMRVVVWNLGDAPKTGSIQARGGDFAKIPPRITIPAMGKVEFDTVFTPRAKPGGFEGHIVLSGVFDGKNSTRLVIPVRPAEQNKR